VPGDSSLGLFHSISVIPLMHATNPTQRQWHLGARADLASEPTGRNRQSPWQPWKDVMNTELSQTTHATNWGEPFAPMRTGFDHMGLRVADPSRLDEWDEHFQRLDVNHTPTVHADYGSVLTFRDPTCASTRCSTAPSTQELPHAEPLTLAERGNVPRRMVFQHMRTGAKR
jgi:hypothetical protein